MHLLNYKAVLWACENGVTSGTGNGTFSPKKVCTRAETVVFIRNIDQLS